MHGTPETQSKNEFPSLRQWVNSANILCVALSELSFEAWPVEPDSQTVVAALSIDVPCIHCGYNLRGLVPGGMCPECGHAIDEALRGDLLRFANPDWLRKLRLGIALQLWGIGLGIILGAIGGGLVAGGVIGPQFIPWVQFIGIAIGLWGTFALTTREPREALQDEGASVRTVLRTTACLNPVAHMMHICADLIPDVALQVAGIVGVFLGPLQNVFFLVYLRRLAARVPDDKLYRSSSRLIYVGAVCYGLFAAAAAYMFVQFNAGALPPPGAAAGGPPVLPMVLTGVMGVLGLVLLVLFLWYVRLLSKYRKVLAEQVRLAEGAMV